MIFAVAGQFGNDYDCYCGCGLTAAAEKVPVDLKPELGVMAFLV